MSATIGYCALLDEEAPNYSPSDAIDEFVKDFKNRYPNGIVLANEES